MRNLNVDYREMYSSDTLVIDEDFTLDVIEDPECENASSASAIKGEGEPDMKSELEALSVGFADASKDDSNLSAPESSSSGNAAPALRKPFANQKITTEELAVIKHLKILLSEDMLKVPYMCPVCEFKMPKPGLFVAHLDSHIRGETCYQCRYCRHATFIKAQFTRHKALCYYPTKLPCPQCSFVTTRSRNLRKHVQNRHLTARARVHLCHKCDFKSDSSDVLLEHKELIHHKVHKRPTYKCTLCEFETKNKKALERHRREHAKKSI